MRIQGDSCLAEAVAAGGARPVAKAVSIITSSSVNGNSSSSSGSRKRSGTQSGANRSVS